MKFIIFEGIDGCGKSTQVKNLAAVMQKKGLPFITTRQPSDGPVGKLMRTATDGFLPLENETMALLVAADRYQHVCTEIKPALAAGQYVLCDRYYYSSFAFQGIDPGAFSRVAAYNAQVITRYPPDVVFFIDTAPAECIRRITTNRDYGGLYDDEQKLTTIRARYMEIFEKASEKKRVIFINGNADEKQVTVEILSHLPF